MKKYLTLALILVVQGAPAQTFEGLDAAIENDDHGQLKAVVIAQHGEILFEAYYRGAGPGTLHTLNSVTKSVGSALIGIAHRQGRIQLDQPLHVFLDDLYPMTSILYQDKRLITVEQVLQQRLGIEWDEWTIDYGTAENPVGQMIDSGDWYQYLISQPMGSLPGEQFAYSTGGSTLMSRLIRFSTGLGPDDFAMQELFGPLGIEQVRWEISNSNGQGIGAIDWPNPDGDPPLGFSLWLRPLDMLKIGELYRQGGVYNGRRILDASWVEASVEPYSHSGNTDLFAGNPGSGYGYQWWVHELTDSRGRTWPGYYASGWGRQHILVYPDLDLVVASVADDYDYEGPGIGAILRNFVMPELSPAMDRRFNGAWYDFDVPGQGLTLEILDQGQRVIGFWYTYGENDERRWFTFDGPVSGGEADVTILEFRGGVFLQSSDVESFNWGSGRLRIVDCNRIDFDIDSAEVNTTIPLTRLSGSCDNPR